MYLPHPTPINYQYILYTNKHHKLRHSKCGREKFGSGHRQNDGKKKKTTGKTRTAPAHGRAVKEDLTWVDSFSSQESALLLVSVSCCRPRGAWILGKRMGFDLDTEDEK